MSGCWGKNKGGGAREDKSPALERPKNKEKGAPMSMIMMIIMLHKYAEELSWVVFGIRKVSGVRVGCLPTRF